MSDFTARSARWRAVGVWLGALLVAVLLILVASVASASAEGEECDTRSSVCFGVDWKRATASDLADIDINDGAQPGRFSPLHAAVVHGSADSIAGLARGLLRMGADIDAQDASGLTPLHYAVFSRRAEDVALLLKSGANVNIAGIEGNTPLHLAGVFGWHSVVIKNLLEHGADTEKRNLDGYTPLLAASRDSLLVPERPGADVYKTLLRASDINARDDNGYSALHLAVAGRNAVAVSVLLEVGADVDILQDGSQITPLAVAILHPHNENVVRLLLVAGANPCVEYPNGGTVLEVSSVHSYQHLFGNFTDGGGECPVQSSENQ